LAGRGRHIASIIEADEIDVVREGDGVGVEALGLEQAGNRRRLSLGVVLHPVMAVLSLSDKFSILTICYICIKTFSMF
jgi:hypothetical protein